MTDTTDRTNDLDGRLVESRAALSRRNVLRGLGSVLAASGGSTAVAGATAQPDQSLSVETTDVEILESDSGESDHQHGRGGLQARTTGRISGMQEIGCERCELGVQLKPAGGNSWYGGLQTVQHTPHNSMRVAVTIVLSNFRSGEYQCRLCARPLLDSSSPGLSVGNPVTVTVEGEAGRDHTDDKDSPVKPGKLRRAARRQCPCHLHHPNRTHLTVTGGGSTVHDYTFRSSRRDITRNGASAAPHAISDRHVTVTDTDDYIAGRVVTGTVAGGGDSFLFSGELTDMHVDDGISVYIHGMEVTDAIAVY